MPDIALSTVLAVMPALASALMLLGLGLIVVVPFFPGLALILSGTLLSVGGASYAAGALSGMSPWGLGAAVLISLIGLGSPWWSARLGLNFTYTSQEVRLGAVIGSLIGLFALGALPSVGMLLGLFLGALVMEMRAGRPFTGAARQGAASLLSMVGPRGFHLLMALAVCDLTIHRI